MRISKIYLLFLFILLIFQIINTVNILNKSVMFHNNYDKILEDFNKSIHNLNESNCKYLRNETNICYSKFNNLKYAIIGDINYFKKYFIKYMDLPYDKKMIFNYNFRSFKFNEYNPITLNKIINDDSLSILKDYYRNLINSGKVKFRDEQSNRYCQYNEALSRIIHLEFLPYIEKILNKKLIPTYSYLASYIKNSSLPPHTDNLDCQITVSFLINKDSDWPLFLSKIKEEKKNSGLSYLKPFKENCFKLEIDCGGIIIFDGTDHIHYREKYLGSFYDVLLLHYKRFY